MNYIYWYEGQGGINQGGIHKMDDTSSNPVTLTPHYDNLPDRNLFVIYNVPPFSSTSSGSVSEINDRPKKTNS